MSHNIPRFGLMVLLPNVVVCCDLSLPSLGFGLLVISNY